VSARGFLGSRCDIDAPGGLLRAQGNFSGRQPAASALPTHVRRVARGTAPVCRAATCPWRKTSKAGMAWPLKRCQICGDMSTFTLTSLTLPARSRASCSSAGLTMRQDPHHGARRSAMTRDPGGLGHLGEGCVVSVGDPRQRLVARAEAGCSRRRGRDPVSGAAMTAPDNPACHGSIYPQPAGDCAGVPSPGCGTHVLVRVRGAGHQADGRTNWLRARGEQAQLMPHDVTACLAGEITSVLPGP
jgi:hypothetical protein